jgi:phosphoribosylformylglycinamidine cyclo-ligase
MAEHPDVMEPGDYDLSGFCVGVVDRPRMVDGSDVKAGDVILGLASSGLHSNGFSLVRKAMVEGREAQLELPRADLGGRTLGAALLEPTRIYVKPVLETLHSGARVKAMAHVTGGGITENLDRCLPHGVDAVVHRGSWPVPRIIGAVIEAASLPADEAYRTFNMGVGFALILDSKDAPDVAAALRMGGETVYEIGEIVQGDGRVRYR